MEQIYTIPVNEAFEASRDDHTCGCPMCSLFNKLENNELEDILGAAMMEPDIRIKTNKEGFCKTHYDMMFTRKNRLGMALTLESHIDELMSDLKGGGLLAPKPQKRLADLDKTCYVCRKIEFNFRHMIETVVYLWDKDEEFAEKLKAQPYFCLPHYRMLIEAAEVRLQKKRYAAFSKDCAQIVGKYMEELKGDVSWFCKKFDYRYGDEPWYNSKDAVERAMKFIRSDIHTNEPPKYEKTEKGKANSI